MFEQISAMLSKNVRRTLSNRSAVALLMLVGLGSGVSPLSAQQESDSAGAAAGGAVVFETSLGSFEVALYPQDAPKTVENFLSYVDQGFYDGTLFHRVIPGFVIQGGGLDRALNRKPTLPPVVNESGNGRKNLAGTLSMARTADPDSATSQFFINLTDNNGLDPRGQRPGYTVFGIVADGHEVIDAIAQVPTETMGQMRDVPVEDVVIISARRAGESPEDGAGISFTAGEDYVVLDEPVAVRDAGKIEVIEAFSYGCPYCFQLDPYVQVWRQQLQDDVDFYTFHAAWNDSMRLYARAYLSAEKLGVLEEIHVPLFNALQAEQQTLRSPGEMAEFFEAFGVSRDAFIAAFRSDEVQTGLREAEQRVQDYQLSGVPQFIVNGKYRVDPVRADGRQEMLQVVDFLIEKERTARHHAD